MYVYISLVSIVMFVAIINIIDKNNVNTHKPPLSLSVKAGMFVLCFVATATVFSLMTEEPIVVDDPGHLTYINQEIQTGFPDF